MIVVTEEHKPDDIEALKKKIIQLEKIIQRKDRRIDDLLRDLWNKSSEKRKGNLDDDSHAWLFNEIELIDKEEKNKEKTITVPAHERTKKSKSKKIPDHYERKIVVHEIDEKDRICPCGCVMEAFSQYERETLVVPKLQPYVNKEISLKYKCNHCKGKKNTGDKPEILQAPLPPIILPQTIATPELLAHTIYSKFELHLSIYRIEGIYKALEIPITSKNLCNWLINVHDKIKDKFDFIINYIKSGPIIGIDESPFQVHKEPGRSDTSQSYIWVIRGGPPGRELCMYLYKDTRSAEYLQDILRDYKGFIITDDHASYDSRLGSEHGDRMAKCNAHARRKFIKLADNKNGDAIKILDLYAGLYKVEAVIRKKQLFVNCKFDEIKAIRQQYSKPIMDEMRSLLETISIKTLSSDGIMEGIRYFYNNIEGLTLFLDHGEVTIDTNLIENKVRPFAIGRKNWLFAGSPSGANTSAFWYTIVDALKSAEVDRHHGISELLHFLSEDRSSEEVETKFWKILGW
ncbi:MAG: IS66 family transposase [Leptospira sp.]|nr:IS66 family transposase [Leptospira sp.]